MTQEEKQLVFKDLCARLPYGVVVERTYIPENNGYTSKLSANTLDFVLEDNWLIKPYLRPMSSMTEEEIKEFSAFGFEVVNHINANRDECPKYQVIEVSNFSEITKVTDWLNKKMFDYRGLIPMGLALEAKEGMYES